MHVKAFTNYHYVAICFVNWHHDKVGPKLSWRLSRDLLIIAFLSVVLGDLMFLYLCVKVLFLSSDNLITEFFHSVNSSICLCLSFRPTAYALINIGKDTFLNNMKSYRYVPIDKNRSGAICRQSAIKLMEKLITN